ncbi:MAG: glycosyl hydrolase family 28-related protein, partial [Phycisphaerae bacterium]
PRLPSLDWEPRSDWLNVRRFGAKGDGKADDTEALQRALDQVRSGSTVYLPAGTYRVTETLTLKGPLIGVLIVGHGGGTRIVWDGAAGSNVFTDDGVSYSRFVGLTFDGRNKAAVGFYHYSTKRFETEVTHQHLAFFGFTGAGVLAARGDRYALAETTFDNCWFENCRRGVAFISFNDYNYTFDGCEFRRCDIGIECRHGNFYARNCHFRDSRIVDVLAQPEHGCSLRRCTSRGSDRFLDFANSVSPMTIQDCHVAEWKSRDGAVLLNGAPVIMFDCGFSDPPGPEGPVRVMRAGQRLIVSENVARGSAEVVRDSTRARLYRVPAGQRKGSVRSAERRFFRAAVRIPGKVFDARRDFGAKADRSSDDTLAVQRCIDAARAGGKGAIAYLPTGDYVIKDTLRISGKDYFVGGSGFQTRLIWRGAEGGTMVAVHDPDHVTLGNMAVGNHDSGPMTNGVDVLQTGSGRPSHMTYDGLFVYGMYQKQPLRKGLRLNRLGTEAVVVLSHVQGNLRFTDCARATILAGTSFEGSVIVEGKDKRRDGFLGFLTRLATLTTHGLYLKDNQSIVMSDLYIEQADNGFVFEGSPDCPRGRATIQGAKLHFTVPKGSSGKGTAMTLGNYGGEIFFGHNQFYVEPAAVRVAHTGTSPVELFLLANLFYRTRLAVTRDKTLKLRLLANEGVANVSPADSSVSYLETTDVEPQEALKALPRALDDLRRLGEVDLRLNHPDGEGD